MTNHIKEAIDRTHKQYEYTCLNCAKKWQDQYSYDVTACPFCGTKGRTKDKNE